MSQKSSKSTIPCDRNGKPLKPRDTDWRVTLKRSIIFILVGIVLLPVGLILYILDSSSSLNALLLLYAVLIFLGTYLLLNGVLFTIFSIKQMKKEPPFEVISKNALLNGERCDAEIVSVKTIKAGKGEDSQTLYVYKLKYYDTMYEYTRSFVSHPTAHSANIGDVLPVYYFPESNLGYFVDAEKIGDLAKENDIKKSIE